MVFFMTRISYSARLWSCKKVEKIFFRIGEIQTVEESSWGKKEKGSGVPLGCRKFCKVSSLSWGTCSSSKTKTSIWTELKPGAHLHCVVLQFIPKPKWRQSTKTLPSTVWRAFHVPLTALYCTIRHYTTLYNLIHFYTTLSFTVVLCTVLYSTLLYYT